MPDNATVDVPSDVRTIVIQQPAKSGWIWGLAIALAVMTLLCLLLFAAVGASLSGTTGSATADVIERVESGTGFESEKVAIIDIVGTISPPLTGRVIKHAEKAAADDAVKAVLLRIDSPGGLVADSHQIYHVLKELSDKKPVYASFGRLAASGGYYVAMGIGSEGKIFVEPTTWTGSIGVIIPHYQVSELTNSVGIKVTPLTTGEFKDALSPFKELSERERDLWQTVMADAFDRFKKVIDDNRAELTEDQIADAATGQIFTSAQALEHGLVDAEGYEDDALDTLKTDLGLSDVKVIRYAAPPSVLDVLTGSVEATAIGQSRADWVQELRTSLTPQALYLFGWPTVSVQ